MIVRVFTVYDAKADLYLAPFTFKETAEAVRAFTSSCLNGETPMGKYPGDLTLFELGTYDDQTAEILLEKAKVAVVNGLEVASRAADLSETRTILKEVK